MTYLMEPTTRPARPQILAFGANHTIDVRRVGMAAAQEVVGKIRIGTIDDRELLAPDLLLAPIKCNLLLGLHQAMPALIFDFFGQMAFQSCGRSTWLKRIGEYSDSLKT